MSEEERLLNYLGELTYDLEHNKDYFDRIKIEAEIEATHISLGLPYVKTNSMINLYKKLKVIPETTFYSTCCGAEVKMIEIDICPMCLEHCDFEEL